MRTRSEPASGTRHVLILNIDTFAAKNVSQIRLLEAVGYDFTVVTPDARGTSRWVFDAQGFARSRLMVVRGIGGKIRKTLGLLFRSRFHHVEFYPGGRLAPLYLIAMKLLRHKVVVVERGDIGSIHLYDRVTRLSLRIAYRAADFVIYKEPYMAQLLRSFTAAPLLFAPNSGTPSVGPLRSHRDRSIDFLWVNRMTVQRRPEWFVRALREPSLAGCSAAMLGFNEAADLPAGLRARQDAIRSQAGVNVRLEGFIDPQPLYPQARFFCVPSELVFGNNSMLEAMAHGVVPIVTRSPGIEAVVRDGLNGFVTALDESAYRDCMVRAAALAPEEWATLSAAARSTIERDYSPEAWQSRMAEHYRRIAAVERSRFANRAAVL